ncbi:MAG: tRNA pseudouridine(13) synthase TruD [Meiothermus sp.]
MSDLTFDFSRYPYLSADLSGTGGRIRSEPQDFQVEEVPAYTPSGEGEHLYLFIEKEGLTTRAVFEFIRDTLAVPEAGIGVAGLKDKRALTRQWISIPAKYEARVSRLEELPGVRILEQGLHSNKLRVGHLRGNRFKILIRDASEDARSRAEAVLRRLEAQGVPNYFGPQRFGIGGLNPQKGYELVTRGKGRGAPWLKKFLIASLQSLLFNDWLALRLGLGLYAQVVRGDVAKKHDSGGEFLVEDPQLENPRAARLEISAMGPLYGKRYFEAEGEARALEDQILERYRLRREQFAARKGARRVIRFPLGEWAVSEAPEGIWVSFFLPKGAYATAVLREVMKTNPDAGEIED